MNAMNYSRKAARELSVPNKLEQVRLWTEKVTERAALGNTDGIQEAAKQITRWKASAEAKMVNSEELAWNYASKCGRFLYCEGEDANTALAFTGELLGMFDSGKLKDYEAGRQLTLELYPQHATAWQAWDDGIRKAASSRMAGRQTSASPKTGKKK